MTMAATERLCAGNGEKGAPAGAFGQGPTPRPDPARPAILIIEDDFFVATHMESMLAELEHTVCGVAANPQAAIREAVSASADLLLVDINLGAEIDGVETARLIRAQREVAVIFVTAYSDPRTLERIRAAFPAAPVLSKPVALVQLAEAIRRVSQPTS
jgi:CheY-like chemotaxis protein